MSSMFAMKTLMFIASMLPGISAGADCQAAEDTRSLLEHTTLQTALTTPLEAKCQKAVDDFCASSCYPQIRSRPCDGPMTARAVAGAPHGLGWKCYSPSCLSANFTKYIGGGCFCSDDAQIRGVLQQTADCAPPVPPPTPIPFGFAKALGDGMVIAAGPKRAMVWGFCAPGDAVEVHLDGGEGISATIGPDQATGARTTWRALLPATAASFDNHTITGHSMPRPSARPHVGTYTAHTPHDRCRCCPRWF